MKILIIDDHELFREGLRHLLAGIDDHIEFHELDSVAAAADFPSPGNIDLVLLDYHLPDMSGLEALARVRQTFDRATLVVISGEDDAATMHRVIVQGASGFIPKSSSREILFAALKLVLAGGVYLPPALLTVNATNPVQRTDVQAPLNSLSNRQRDVLLHAIQGKSNKVIARELAISDHTVKAHLAVAFRVLNVKNRNEAVYAAARLGIGNGSVGWSNNKK